MHSGPKDEDSLDRIDEPAHDGASAHESTGEPRQDLEPGSADVVPEIDAGEAGSDDADALAWQPGETQELPAGDDTDEDADAEPDRASTLSPSVRRLVKQYDLDVTQLRGTGPEGRIRTNDVIAMLGNRAAPPAEETEPNEAAAEPVTPVRKPEGTARLAAPVTSVFECDMTAALTHRKQILSQKSEILLTSYYVFACLEALEAVPEVNGRATEVRLGIALSAADGHTVTPVLSGARSLTDINEALREYHQKLLAGEPLDADRQSPSFFVYHHGLTGSLLATPTPMGEQHAASLGIGRIRRQVVVQNVSGQQGPRIAPFCYVSLTFDPEVLDMHRANQFLTSFVRTLEQWPAS